MTAARHESAALTVILLTPGSFDVIRTTVAHLAAQTIADRIELLVLAGSARALELDREATAAFHSVRVLETGPLSASGPARARGAREATAPVVVYAEDHCYPDPQWAAALLEAHGAAHAAVGPAVRNANPESVVSWADLFTAYGPWLAPARAGAIGLLPGHNSSYKRDVLLSFGAELDTLMEAETVLFWRLREQGHTLWLEPRATVAHVNFSRWGVWLPAEWYLGRVFAATRAARWSPARRLAFALASPLIPAVRLARIIASARRNGVPASLVARTLPALLVGLTVNGVAQGVGCVAGAGGSLPLLTALEFHRVQVNRDGRAVASRSGAGSER